MSAFLVSTVGYSFALPKPFVSLSRPHPPLTTCACIFNLKAISSPSYVLNLFSYINDVSFDNYLKTGRPP